MSICPVGKSDAEFLARPHKYPSGYKPQMQVDNLPPMTRWCNEARCMSVQFHSWKDLNGASLADVRRTWANYKGFDFSGCIVPPGTTFENCDFREAKKEGIAWLKKHNIVFVNCLF